MSTQGFKMIGGRITFVPVKAVQRIDAVQFEHAGIKLSFENVGMEATRLSAQEANLLEGLY